MSWPFTWSRIADGSDRVVDVGTFASTPLRAKVVPQNNRFRVEVWDGDNWSSLRTKPLERCGKTYGRRARTWESRSSAKAAAENHLFTEVSR